MTSQTRPLLAVDVGNTRIKLGLFTQQSCNNGLPAPAHVLELGADAFDQKRLLAWLCEAGIEGPAACKWWIASVNRPPTERLITWLKSCDVELCASADIQGSTETHEPTSVSGYCLLKYSDLPLEVSLPEPERVGIDRLLGAVAVNRLRTATRPAIVIDVGSAITVDLISSIGAFLGGAILPGIVMSARAMHNFTDLLPMIAMDELADPPAALGMSTVGAMRSGLYWGSIGAMKELIARLAESLPSSPAAPEIFLTGGAAPLVADFLNSSAKYHAHLVLSGIAIVGGQCL